MGLFLEHGDSRDDVTSVLYFRFLKKNKNKVVSNRCNRCVDSSRDHTWFYLVVEVKNKPYGLWDPS